MTSISEGELFRILLIVLLVAAIFGAAPVWPHARAWGYPPVLVLVLVLLIVAILL